MCGIVGLLDLQGAPVSAEDITAMAESLAYRGPDGQGVWCEGPVGLGHRRLAVIDPSPAGAQPMRTADGRLTLTYSGEVYNFYELRRALETHGVRFRSRSDTEVVLQAYAAWGPACVERFNGMFAFAIWDSRARQLFLARDRYGIKPLYYARHGSLLAFASEIKALLTLPQFPRRLSAQAVSEYFTFQNIFSDVTLFEGVRLLPPAHTLTVSELNDAPQLHRYWDYEFTDAGFALSDAEAQERLFELFGQAVQRQLISDVPLGSYLSGGMDSGSITAVASQTLRRLPTFTCGFDLSSVSGLELGVDERRASEMLSHRFKTEHYEVVLKAGDMEAVMPQLIRHLEDLRVGQCYPNFYIARLASKFVKVALSGTGGDELFGGYPWRYYRPSEPLTLEAHYQRYYNSWQRLLPDEDRPKFFNAETWKAVKSHEPRDVFRGVFGARVSVAKSVEDFVNLSLYFEAKTFLHGLLLVEDKLSMAHGLETRLPFMDNDLVEFAMRLPVRMKIARLQEVVRLDENEPGPKAAKYFQRTRDGKQILRRAMSRLLPEDVTQLAKQGFSAPDATWFRGESVEYIRGILTDANARLYEHINPDYVRGVLEQHCSGRANRRLLIWSLLSFEWWLREFLPASAGPRSASLGKRADLTAAASR